MADHSPSEATYLLRLEEYKMLRASAADFTRTQATLIGFGLTAVALIVNRGGRAAWVIAGVGLAVLMAVWLFYLLDLRRVRRHLVRLEEEVNQAARDAYDIEVTTTLLTWEREVDAAGGDFLNLLRSVGRRLRRDGRSTEEERSTERRS